MLRPAILWNDQRTSAESRRVKRAIGLERYVRLRLGGEPATGVSDASATLLLGSSQSPTGSRPTTTSANASGRCIPRCARFDPHKPLISTP